MYMDLPRKDVETRRYYFLQESQMTRISKKDYFGNKKINYFLGGKKGFSFSLKIIFIVSKKETPV